MPAKRLTGERAVNGGRRSPSVWWSPRSRWSGSVGRARLPCGREPAGVVVPGCGGAAGRARRWRRPEAPARAGAGGARALRPTTPARAGRPPAARVPLLRGGARRPDRIGRGGPAQPARRRARARPRRHGRPARPAACRQVAAGTANGSPMEVDLSPLEQRGREPAAVLGQVRGLGDGFTVVEATDSSDAVRMEATRRDFVANVSHELKTPVGAMGLLAEAVLDAADDPDDGAPVRRARCSAESNRLGNMVSELIALSRLTGRRTAARARGRRRRQRGGRGAVALPAGRRDRRHRDHHRRADRARGPRRPARCWSPR